MPKIKIDVLLLMIIIAGMGLAVAYLRAEYVLHRRFKAAGHETPINGSSISTGTQPTAIAISD